MSSISRLSIGICTFRRASVEQTLRSIPLAIPQGIAVTVIVADNDVVPSAKALVERVAAEIGLDCRYIHAPSCNISVARNACLDACRDGWLAFVDDDEIAQPGWHAALAASANSDLAALFGPVRASYPHRRPFLLSFSDFHSTALNAKRRPLKAGYTGNVLINLRHPAVRGRRFDPAFGESGGEDNEYFMAIYQAGGRFAWVPQAIILGPVPPERDTIRYIVARGFRGGNNTCRVLLAHSGSLDIAIAMARAGLGLVKNLILALPLLIAPWWLARVLVPACGQIGFFAYFFGVTKVVGYGKERDPAITLSSAARQRGAGPTLTRPPQKSA